MIGRIISLADERRRRRPPPARMHGPAVIAPDGTITLELKAEDGDSMEWVMGPDAATAWGRQFLRWASAARRARRGNPEGRGEPSRRV